MQSRQVGSAAQEVVNNVPAAQAERLKCSRMQPLAAWRSLV